MLKVINIIYAKNLNNIVLPTFLKINNVILMFIKRNLLIY